MDEDILKEAGLPPNWGPISQSPIRPGAPVGAPPMPNSMGDYFQGSISPSMQHDAVFVGTEYGSPCVPTIALMPIGSSGIPSLNSAIQSLAANTKITPSPTPPKPVSVPGQLFEVNGDGIFSVMYSVNGVIL